MVCQSGRWTGAAVDACERGRPVMSLQSDRPGAITAYPRSTPRRSAEYDDLFGQAPVIFAALTARAPAGGREPGLLRGLRRRRAPRRARRSRKLLPELAPQGVLDRAGCGVPHRYRRTGPGTGGWCSAGPVTSARDSSTSPTSPAGTRRRSVDGVRRARRRDHRVPPRPAAGGRTAHPAGADRPRRAAERDPDAAWRGPSRSSPRRLHRLGAARRSRRAHLRHGTGPSLPAFYNEAIDGIAIGEGVGSCGTAAHRREPVIVTDIATDAVWDDYRDLAARAGLAACWSTPILARGRPAARHLRHVPPRAPRPPRTQ